MKQRISKDVIKRHKIEKKCLAIKKEQVGSFCDICGEPVHRRSLDHAGPILCPTCQVESLSQR